MAIRVVLAEDNLLVREGVRRLLETRRDRAIEVVASCGDLDALLAAVEAEQPDVVVTDIRMPPTHTDEGLQVAARLRKTQPQVGVVLLSQFDAPAYARALLEEGSAGRAYLLKERVSDPEQLVGAIREVARGGSVIDSKVVETLVAALDGLLRPTTLVPRTRGQAAPARSWPSRSPSASSKCWDSSRRAPPTRRSLGAWWSASPRSRRTSTTSLPSSTPRAASRSWRGPPASVC